MVLHVHRASHPIHKVEEMLRRFKVTRLSACKHSLSLLAEWGYSERCCSCLLEVLMVRVLLYIVAMFHVCWYQDILRVFSPNLRETRLSRISVGEDDVQRFAAEEFSLRFNIQTHVLNIPLKT